MLIPLTAVIGAQTTLNRGNCVIDRSCSDQPVEARTINDLSSMSEYSKTPMQLVCYPFLKCSLLKQTVPI